jgi:uncharacterized protein (TIGR00299 family) protein
MRIAYLDVFAGISGDMTLGALVDAGVPLDALRAELEKIPMHGWTMRAEKATRQGIAGTLVHVELVEHHHHDHEHHGHHHHHGRSCRELVDLIEASSLEADVISRSTEILWRIARAEAKIHDTTPEEVHFHELGGLDSIVDIVGAVVGFRMLGVEQIVCSPLPISHGFVDCAHGRLPVPAPATAALMVGAPTFPLDVEGETVTPTGAALATGLAGRMGEFPAMSVQAIGYGCGQKTFPGVPNVLRLFVGERSDLMPGIEGGEGAWDRPITDRISLLEANIDDMNPELFGHVMQRLFEAGAADVWMSPVFMKKNRPATQLSAVAEPAKLEAVAETILRETTSFGVRISSWERRCLPRKRVTVQTPFGEVRVKLGTIGDTVVQASPEYEDCLAAAKAHDVALKDVYAAACAVARGL